MKYFYFEGKCCTYLLNSAIVDGEIVEIKIKLVKGRRPLTGSNLKDFEVFLEKNADKIVEKWVDYFIYHKNIEFEKINTRIV